MKTGVATAILTCCATAVFAGASFDSAKTKAASAKVPAAVSNEEAYQAGAEERAMILAEAKPCADLKGREKPANAFRTPSPSNIMDPAGYAKLRERNEAFLGNIEYWRNQLPANYKNLLYAVEVNDLETARTLLGYMKKDSAALDNEIGAVKLNNRKAEAWPEKSAVQAQTAAAPDKAAQNEALYQAGARDRAMIAAECEVYSNLDGRQAPKSAFKTPAPADLMNVKEYEALRTKTEGFIRNVNYWNMQLSEASKRVSEAIRVNDLATASRLRDMMKKDSADLDNELKAVVANNRLAAAWPKNLSNQQRYEAGAKERDAIREQALSFGDVDDRKAPANAFRAAVPSGADSAKWNSMREKNDAYASNIEYWRNQLVANHKNLLYALEVNDLETARILRDHMKKDSAALDNEIAAMRKLNAQAK